MSISLKLVTSNPSYIIHAYGYLNLKRFKTIYLLHFESDHSMCHFEHLFHHMHKRINVRTLIDYKLLTQDSEFLLSKNFRKAHSFWNMWGIE